MIRIALVASLIIGISLTPLGCTQLKSSGTTAEGAGIDCLKNQDWMKILSTVATDVQKGNLAADLTALEGTATSIGVACALHAVVAVIGAMAPAHSAPTPQLIAAQQYIADHHYTFVGDAK